MPAPHRVDTGSSPGHVGFVIDKVALGQVFSEYFGFPCQFSFHRLFHTHHLSSGAGTMGRYWPTYQSDCLTPPQETKQKYTYYLGGSSPPAAAEGRDLGRNSSWPRVEQSLSCSRHTSPFMDPKSSYAVQEGSHSTST
jgi:hypothetical protein